MGRQPRIVGPARRWDGHEDRQANHASRSGRVDRRRSSFRVAGHPDPSSRRSRYRHPFHPHRPARARDREISADYPLRHRHRIRHRPRRCVGPAGVHRRARPRCAARASAWTTPSSRSTVPKCRSWTAAPRPFVARDRSGRPRIARRRRAASSACSSRCRVAIGDAVGEFRPYSRGFRIEAEIEFDHPLIGRQTHRLSTAGPRPSAAISRAPAPSASCATSRSCGAPVTRSARRSRTRWSSATAASSIRKARASRTSSCATRCSTRSAIWRWPARRCSALYRSVRGGHKLNHAALSALMADTSAWTVVEAEPVRPARGHGDLAAGLAAPAYAPGRLLTLTALDPRLLGR